MSGFLGASSVRMRVNPMGILEGVASRPTGRAWLWRQQLSGPETPLEFQLWERGWLCGSVFSAGAFQADSALVVLCGAWQVWGTRPTLRPVPSGLEKKGL